MDTTCPTLPPPFLLPTLSYPHGPSYFLIYIFSTQPCPAPPCLARHVPPTSPLIHGLALTSSPLLVSPCPPLPFRVFRLCVLTYLPLSYLGFLLRVLPWPALNCFLSPVYCLPQAVLPCPPLLPSQYNVRFSLVLCVISGSTQSYHAFLPPWCNVLFIRVLLCLPFFLCVLSNSPLPLPCLAFSYQTYFVPSFMYCLNHQ